MSTCMKRKGQHHEADDPKRRGVKITNTSARHYGMHYLEGLNTDVLPWNPDTNAQSGLHFAPRDYIHRWLRVGKEDGSAALLWDVEVPPGVPVEHSVCDEARAHSIILSNPRRIPDDIYMAAVRHNAHSLRFVPNDRRTEAMCRIAAEGTPSAMQHIPDGVCAETIFFAVMERHSTLSILHYVPKAKRTHAMCLATVQRDGSMLREVPQTMRTEAVCLAAVKSSVHAMRHVPKSVFTEAIYLAVVQHHDDVLQWIPVAARTEAVCLAAVRRNPRAFFVVPNTRHTEAIFVATMEHFDKAETCAEHPHFEFPGICSTSRR